MMGLNPQHQALPVSLSLASDLEIARCSPPIQNEAEKYSHLPTYRKYTILFIVSWMTLATVYSSTSLLPATPEIASEFSTTIEIINITNAGVLIAMGLSSFIWGPISEIIGRRKAYNAAVFVLLGCSVGIALAPDMRTFTVMRVLGGFQGTYFMVAGQTIIADIFEPRVWGRAVGFFIVGSVSGPAIGPCIGGIIVTFTTWRLIYWLQVAMVGLGLVSSLLFVPDIQQIDKQEEPCLEKKEDSASSSAALQALAKFNASRIFGPLIYPNVLLADITCGFLATYQYALLTSTRSIINPHFHLTTPLVSGLFYIAPGAGFLVGSVLGGHLSDRTVLKYIILRKGVRLPQDRLNSGLLPLFFVLPIAALVYGWTLQENVGGLALPVITAFAGGMGLMGSFNGLNTYTAEVLPHKRSEVISGKYIIQYCFAAGSSAAVVPLINAIGIGWTFSICVILTILGGCLVLVIAKRGLDMQRWVDNWRGSNEEI